jgi:hypothetical protein
MALIVSGAVDALIGSVLLLIGFRLLPIDVTQYGFESWQALLAGGLFFVTGVGVAAYNVSRLEE